MTHNRRVVAIIQARSNSKRLPGKAFQFIGDWTMTKHVVRRVLAVKECDKVVLAVPESDHAEFNKHVNEIDQTLGKEDHDRLSVFSTTLVSDDDVLRRIVRTADHYEADIVVRVTGDCPLWCPHIGADAINQFVNSDASIVSTMTHYKYISPFGNDLPYSGCPDGTDVEVVSFESLSRLDRGFVTKEYREHVTKAYYEGYGMPVMVRSGWQFPGEGSAVKLSVDWRSDLDKVRLVHARLADPSPNVPLVKAWVTQ